MTTEKQKDLADGQGLFYSFYLLVKNQINT